MNTVLAATPTTVSTATIAQRTRAAGSQMALLIATAARAEALGPERAEKVRELLKARVADERSNALRLLEDEIREAGLVH
jgi:hypothetical protein